MQWVDPMGHDQVFWSHHGGLEQAALVQDKVALEVGAAVGFHHAPACALDWPGQRRVSSKPPIFTPGTIAMNQTVLRRICVGVMPAQAESQAVQGLAQPTAA